MMIAFWPCFVGPSPLPNIPCLAEMYTFDWNKGKKWWLLLGQKRQSVALLRLCRLQTFISKFDPPLVTSNVCSCQSMNRRTLTTKQFIDGAWGNIQSDFLWNAGLPRRKTHTQKSWVVTGTVSNLTTCGLGWGGHVCVVSCDWGVPTCSVETKIQRIHEFSLLPFLELFPRWFLHSSSTMREPSEVHHSSLHHLYNWKDMNMCKFTYHAT